MLKSLIIHGAMKKNFKVIIVGLDHFLLKRFWRDVFMSKYVFHAISIEFL